MYLEEVISKPSENTFSARDKQFVYLHARDKKLRHVLPKVHEIFIHFPLPVLIILL